MVALDILVKGFDEYYEIVKMLSNVHIFTGKNVEFYKVYKIIDDELLLCDIEYISKRIDIPLDVRKIYYSLNLY